MITLSIVNKKNVKMLTLLMMVLSYLIGSLSFAVIVSKILGMADPRSYGSGNPGATNVLRSGRKIAAILTLLGDALKGWLAVIIAMYVQETVSYSSSVMVALCAVFVLVGHMWPIFFQFKGGKGVATAVGILLALSWQTALICFLIWLLVAVVFRISSLAALVATILSPIVAYFFIPEFWLLGSIFVIALLVFYRHKNNIQKLISGQESKIGN